MQAPSFWLRRGASALALLPITCLYALLLRLHRWSYALGWRRAERLAVPTLVVGNRLAGGAGKTPTTISVVQGLQALGYRVGVISRGYGRSTRDVREVHRQDLPEQVGDEPVLIKRRTGVPVFVGLQRVAAGRALLEHYPSTQLIICDDGLQHRALLRDFEVIVFDERGLGNGWLLPSGPLRESPSTPSGARQQWVVYNAARASTPLAGYMTRARLRFQRFESWLVQADPARHSNQNEAVPQALLDDPALWAVAGLAVPERFFAQLEGLGLHIVRQALADHDPWQAWPWPLGIQQVIVTEKDAVKISLAALARERPNTSLWVACLDLEIEASFWSTLQAALRQPNSP